MPSRITTFSQFEAAQAQLERALALYLDEHDYLSAITLAGAADEVLGRMLEARGGVHQLHQEASALDKIGRKLVGMGVSRREAIADLNEVRDWLKHFKRDADLSFDPQETAHDMLSRAVGNMIALTNNASPRMQRFYEQRGSDV
jgi:hypothetical protein